MDMNIIEMKNIQKIYNPNEANQVNALSGIDLSIKKGDLVAVVGRSGAGKSTLLHILGCLDKATKGDYYLEGINVSQLKHKELARVRNKRIGFVLQEFGLLMNKSVYDNLIVPLIFNKEVSIGDLRPKVNNVLEQVDMYDKIFQDVVELSGGQKQRIAIARAIINNPDIILADEPTGALDTATADNILDLLIELKNGGKTIIIVTHDMRIAKKCDYILKIEDGQLLQE